MTDLLQESYHPADVSVPVLQLSVGELLRGAAAQAPTQTAVISIAPDRDPREWTYAELLADAEHAAAWLTERYRPGEHIAVWAPNVPEWLVLQYGAALAGLVLVTLNPALRRDELAYALTSAEAVGIFYVDHFRGTDMAAILDAALALAPAVRARSDLREWLHEVRATPRRDDLPDVDPQAPTQLQFTSGTTGRPKATLLTHTAMVTNAAYVRARCGTYPHATFATALPLFHTAGCGLAGMGSVYDRGTFVIAELFDPRLLLEAIGRYQVEVLSGVPTMLRAMLAAAAAEDDFSSLRVVMSGGDMVPPALIETLLDRWGAAMSAVYGQTELSPVLCQTGPTDLPADVIHTAGRPLPNVEVSVREPGTGLVRAVGEIGEICARGYQQMLGYYRLPEETARAVDADGWLHTGDLGFMDGRGYVTVTGRLKDLIIRGGENISPAEIEEVLFDHPAVAAAAVLGVPDPEWGQAIAAVITLVPGATAPAATELHALLREKLAPHKTPKSWYSAEQLPVNAMGKVQKAVLGERLREGDLTPL